MAQGLQSFLSELHASGAVTAAAAVLGDARGIAREGGVGVKRRRRSGRVTTSSLFDLASLTKPVTATLALALERSGGLSTRASVGRVLHGSGFEIDPSLRSRRLVTLLRHRSGLTAWAPLFARCRRPEEAVELLTSSPDLLGAAPATYSDLGYILWGLLVEAVTERSLGSLVEERIVRPLGLRGLSEPPGDMPAAVECRLGNQRERQLARAQGIDIGLRRAPSIGAIQDGNARFLGGPAGHAGLFGSARAIWRLAAEWVEPGALLECRQVERALGGRGEFALGWRRSPPAAAGRSGLWYGHTGFTGGGAWFSPETKEIRVLLAHRSSVSVSLVEWRARFLEVST